MPEAWLRNSTAQTPQTENQAIFTFQAMGLCLS